MKLFLTIFCNCVPIHILVSIIYSEEFEFFSNHTGILEGVKMKDKMKGIDFCLFFYFLFVFCCCFFFWCYKTDLLSWISFIKYKAFSLFFLILSFISRPCTPCNFTVNWGHHHICFNLWFPNARSFGIYSLILLWHSTAI